MKKLSLASVIIAFIFSLSYPMGPIAHCTSANAGLACYCCAGADKTCAMYLCSKCNHDAGSDHFVWLYDTLLSVFDLAVFFQPLYPTAEKTTAMKAVHSEVPYRPPKS